MLALNDARARLQTILDNQSAAVLVLSAENEILMANPASSTVLKASDAIRIGVNLDNLPGCSPLANLVKEEFSAMPFSAEGQDDEPRYWQRSTVLQAIASDAIDLGQTGSFSVHAGADDQTQLLVRGAYLPDAQRLLVIDDITEIVSAQRSQAWGEVAKRLAHEIKNPLTPIQLAAERLSRRLESKLEPAEAQVLSKSVNTIVDQVDAMKRLVNEFRDFGRLPAARLLPLELNALIREVLQLYPEHSAVVRIALELADAPLWIEGDAQQLRQVLHNLVQNAQEACEPLSMADGQTRTVRIRTGLVSERQIRLSITDDGPGFAAATLRRAFEPYVTTKAKGTGLGLPVVKKIADEHHARIDVGNRLEKGVVIGAQVSLSFAVAKSQQAGEVVATEQQPASL
jgi:nitrogen fixation/metabolism regulation signal transduction histidine kinase